MIIRPRVFEDEHLPRTLGHRGAEEAQLARAFEPTLSGTPAEDALVWGPPGVGKTVLARHLLDRLQASASFDHAHVECLGKSTAGIIRAVLADLDGTTPAENTPLEDLCLDLRERTTDPVIVILDEAEEVAETNALERLADVDSLSFVVICHEPDEWLSRAPDDVRRRLCGTELPLGRYGVGELADILEARAHVGLRPDVVSRDQLEEIADTVAGVARAGIQSLCAAVTIARERGHQTVRDGDVADAYGRAKEWVRENNLDSLPFHHHVLYELVRSLGPVRGLTLHDHYDDIADDVYGGRDRVPIGKRSRRDKLRKLERYDLIGTDGEGRGRMYWPLDKEVTSPHQIDLLVRGMVT